MVTKVEVMNRKGHEGYEFGTPEEAQEFVRNFTAEGGKYYILDKDTKKLLADSIGIKENQTIVLIPIIAGG